RGAVGLGRALESLAEVRGSRVLNRVALVMDYPSWWGSELDSHPTQALRYSEEMLRWYTALWDLGIGVDIVPTSIDLTGYELVIAPTLYTVSAPEAERLAEAARAGAQVVISFFSGIVDENDHVHLGGHPGAFRDLLGGAHGGVLRPAGGRGAAPGRRHCRRPVEREDASRGRRGGAHLGRRRPARPARGDPERGRRRGRCGLVRGRAPVGRRARDPRRRDRGGRRGGGGR